MADDLGFKPGFVNPSAPPSMYPGSNYPPPPGGSYPPPPGGSYPPPPPGHNYPPGYPSPSYPHNPSYPPSYPSPSYPSPPCPPSYPSPPCPPSPHYPSHPSIPPMVCPSQPPTYPPRPPHCGSNVVTGGHKAYYWMDWSAHRMVPPTAVHGGVDRDGSQIYVGRAFHEGDWIPAKVIPERHTAYVAFGGGEHTKDEFQVLCEQRFDWVPCSGGSIPPGAVEGGRTGSGEPLYVGRVWHDGAHTVGKVHPSHGVCYIPYGGQELQFPDYEILVLRM